MSTMIASTRNTIGMKTLARQVGFSGLGSGAADAIDAGIPPAAVALLQGLGATDAQLEAVAMDPDSEDAANALAAQLQAANGANTTTLNSVLTSFSNLWTNIWTGNVSADQVSTLQQQETAALVQAGMPQEQAAAQAAQDANTSLATFQGKGGLGINWTGALPSQPGFGTALLNDIGAGGTGVATGIANYWPYILGGIGILLVGSYVVKKI